jgi:hypothetical protein
MQGLGPGCSPLPLGEGPGEREASGQLEAPPLRRWKSLFISTIQRPAKPRLVDR